MIKKIVRRKHHNFRYLLKQTQNSKDKIYKSIKNIPDVKVTDINHFNIFDILKYKKLIFTESSVKELEKRLS